MSSPDRPIRFISPRHLGIAIAIASLGLSLAGCDNSPYEGEISISLEGALPRPEFHHVSNTYSLGDLGKVCMHIPPTTLYSVEEQLLRSLGLSDDTPSERTWGTVFSDVTLRGGFKANEQSGIIDEDINRSELELQGFDRCIDLGQYSGPEGLVRIEGALTECATVKKAPIFPVSIFDGPGYPLYKIAGDEVCGQEIVTSGHVVIDRSIPLVQGVNYNPDTHILEATITDFSPVQINGAGEVIKLESGVHTVQIPIDGSFFQNIRVLDAVGHITEIRTGDLLGGLFQDVTAPTVGFKGLGYDDKGRVVLQVLFNDDAPHMEGGVGWEAGNSKDSTGVRSGDMVSIPIQTEPEFVPLDAQKVTACDWKANCTVTTIQDILKQNVTDSLTAGISDKEHKNGQVMLKVWVDQGRLNSLVNLGGASIQVGNESFSLRDGSADGNVLVVFPASIDSRLTPEFITVHGPLGEETILPVTNTYNPLPTQIGSLVKDNEGSISFDVKVLQEEGDFKPKAVRCTQKTGIALLDLIPLRPAEIEQTPDTIHVTCKPLTEFGSISIQLRATFLNGGTEQEWETTIEDVYGIKSLGRQLSDTEQTAASVAMSLWLLGCTAATLGIGKRYVETYQTARDLHEYPARTNRGLSKTRNLFQSLDWAEREIKREDLTVVRMIDVCMEVMRQREKLYSRSEGGIYRIPQINRPVEDEVFHIITLTERALQAIKNSPRPESIFGLYKRAKQLDEFETILLNHYDNLTSKRILDLLTEVRILGMSLRGDMKSITTYRERRGLQEKEVYEVFSGWKDYRGAWMYLDTTSQLQKSFVDLQRDAIESSVRERLSDNPYQPGFLTVPKHLAAEMKGVREIEQEIQRYKQCVTSDQTEVQIQSAILDIMKVFKKHERLLIGEDGCVIHPYLRDRLPLVLEDCKRALTVEKGNRDGLYSRRLLLDGISDFLFSPDNRWAQLVEDEEFVLCIRQYNLVLDAARVTSPLEFYSKYPHLFTLNPPNQELVQVVELLLDWGDFFFIEQLLEAKKSLTLPAGKEKTGFIIPYSMDERIRLSFMRRQFQFMEEREEALVQLSADRQDVPSDFFSTTRYKYGVRKSTLMQQWGDSVGKVYAAYKVGGGAIGQVILLNREFSELYKWSQRETERSFSGYSGEKTYELWSKRSRRFEQFIAQYIISRVSYLSEDLTSMNYLDELKESQDRIYNITQITESIWWGLYAHSSQAARLKGWVQATNKILLAEYNFPAYVEMMRYVLSDENSVIRIIHMFISVGAYDIAAKIAHASEYCADIVPFTPQVQERIDALFESHLLFNNFAHLFFTNKPKAAKFRHVQRIAAQETKQLAVLEECMTHLELGQVAQTMHVYDQYLELGGIPIMNLEFSRRMTKMVQDTHSLLIQTSDGSDRGAYKQVLPTAIALLDASKKPWWTLIEYENKKEIIEVAEACESVALALQDVRVFMQVYQTKLTDFTYSQRLLQRIMGLYAFDVAHQIITHNMLSPEIRTNLLQEYNEELIRFRNKYITSALAANPSDNKFRSIMTLPVDEGQRFKRLDTLLDELKQRDLVRVAYTYEAYRTGGGIYIDHPVFNRRLGMLLDEVYIRSEAVREKRLINDAIALTPRLIAAKQITETPFLGFTYQNRELLQESVDQVCLVGVAISDKPSLDRLYGSRLCQNGDGKKAVAMLCDWECFDGAVSVIDIIQARSGKSPSYEEAKRELETRLASIYKNAVVVGLGDSGHDVTRLSANPTVPSGKSYAGLVHQAEAVLSEYQTWVTQRLPNWTSPYDEVPEAKKGVRNYAAELGREIIVETRLPFNMVEKIVRRSYDIAFNLVEEEMFWFLGFTPVEIKNYTNDVPGLISEARKRIRELITYHESVSRFMNGIGTDETERTAEYWILHRLRPRLTTWFERIRLYQKTLPTNTQGDYTPFSFATLKDVDVNSVSDTQYDCALMQHIVYVTTHGAGSPQSLQQKNIKPVINIQNTRGKVKSKPEYTYSIYI